MSVSAALLGLGATALLDRDQCARRLEGVDFAALPEDLPARLLDPDTPEKTRIGGFFVLSMHPSGYLRQAALIEIARYQSQLSLTASLIRCADWIDEVRATAMHAAAALVGQCHDDDVMAVLPLVARLRIHGRVNRERIDQLFVDWLIDPMHAERREQMLNAPHPVIRRWGYAAAFATAPLTAPHLVQRALHDVDPIIASMALRAIDSAPEEERRQWLSTAIASTHPVIRRNALRAFAKDADSVPMDILRSMLADRAAGVRALAAYFLRTQHQGSPVVIWREWADKGDIAPTGALISLTEVAEAEDESRLLALLSHRNGRVRSAALRGLIRRDVVLPRDTLARVVASSPASVHKTMANLIRRRVLSLDTTRTVELFTDIWPSAAAAWERLFDAMPAREQIAFLAALVPRTGEARVWWNARLASWSDTHLGWWAAEDHVHTALYSLLERGQELDLALRDRFETNLAR